MQRGGRTEMPRREDWEEGGKNKGYTSLRARKNCVSPRQVEGSLALAL